MFIIRLWGSCSSGLGWALTPHSQPQRTWVLLFSRASVDLGPWGLLLSTASCGAGQPGESHQPQATSTGPSSSTTPRASCSEAGGRACPSPTRVKARLRQGRHEGPPSPNLGAFLNNEEQTASLRGSGSLIWIPRWLGPRWGFVQRYSSRKAAQPIVILLGDEKLMNSVFSLAFPVCLRHIVFIYLLMEIQASLAGRVEKQRLVFPRRWLASFQLGTGLDQAL